MQPIKEKLQKALEQSQDMSIFKEDMEVILASNATYIYTIVEILGSRFDDKGDSFRAILKDKYKKETTVSQSSLIELEIFRNLAEPI